MLSDLKSESTVALVKSLVDTIISDPFQRVKAQCELFRWYMDEAYVCYARDNENSVGVTFWLLLANAVEDENKKA